MKIALDLAKQAMSEGEIPVGAIVVSNGRIIGKGYNQTEKLTDVTAHAEMLALTAASHYLGSKYLIDCTLYVTLEPCLMCGGAIGWTHIQNIVIGARDEKRGYINYNIPSKPILHPKAHVINGILEEECGELVRQFFRERRR